MSQNTQWMQRDLAVLWHPCTQMKDHERLPLIPIRRGDGVWLEDFDGKRYLDAVSSWWVNLFGHNHPRMKAAITDQLGRIEHVMLAGLTHAPVVELSERLGALTGLGHAFYGSDGASATEIALKMSAHHWRNAGRPGKSRFIGLAGGYHGETVGALSVTDIPLFREAYAPLLRLSATVPSPDARAAAPGETAADVAHRAADALAAHLAIHGGGAAHVAHRRHPARQLLEAGARHALRITRPALELFGKLHQRPQALAADGAGGFHAGGEQQLEEVAGFFVVQALAVHLGLHDDRQHVVPRPGPPLTRQHGAVAVELGEGCDDGRRAA